jgi:thiol-disulfide isomerase/thioredoxin
MKVLTSFALLVSLLGSLFAAQLQPQSFQRDVVYFFPSTVPDFISSLIQVLESDNAWVVEFYSDMCGSCQEFAPVWETLTRKLKSIKNGKINIDSSEGMKLAQKLGVLDEGIPNIQFYSKRGSAISLMRGMVSSTASPHATLSHCR